MWIPLAMGLAFGATIGERAVDLAGRMVDDVGPRPAGSTGGDLAQGWVAQRIEERGWSAAQTTTGPWTTTWTCRRGRSSKVVLFLAHTDSVHRRVPGAHDNAVSVAVLLTAMAGRIPKRPRRTVCFAFPDAEELGLLGAKGFAAKVIDHGILGGELDQVVALELVGAGHLTHNGLGEAWDGPRLRELLRLAPAEVPWMYRGVSWALPAMERSDHRPFADRGVPSSMLMGRPDAGMLWAYHTKEDRGETLDPATAGAAVRAVRHIARARPLPTRDPKAWRDPAVALGGVVLPGWTLVGALGAMGVTGLVGLLRLDRTVGVALLQALAVTVSVALGVTVAGAGRPLQAALVEEVAAAACLAGVLGLFAWPWRASPAGGRGLASIYGLLALGSSPWLGAVLAAPLVVASMAAWSAAGRIGWQRWPLVVVSAWPLLHLARPAALRELAFHGLLSASPVTWSVWLGALAVPVVAALQGRTLPRRRGPWLLGLLVACAVATGVAWLASPFDDAFPRRSQEWAGRP